MQRNLLKDIKSISDRLQENPSDAKQLQEAAVEIRKLSTRNPEVFSVHEPATTTLLDILFRADRVIHQRISGISIKQLQSKYGIDANTEPASENTLLLKLSDDSLFLNTLEKTVNNDYDFEIFLIKLRHFLLVEHLNKHRVPSEHLRLIAAVAHQCFNNEYIFHETDEEMRAVQEILAQVESPGEEALLALAMYRPLSSLAQINTVASMPLQDFSEIARPVVVRMIHEPQEERKLMDQIPSFSLITDNTSKSVRKQYEENPFPRWIALGEGYSSLEEKLRKVNPRYSRPNLFQRQKLRILVPGCGTGHHPLQIAAANPEAEITAIDLSRRSLTYAMRMACRYKIGNISFLHGDILELSNLGRSFHHIDCVGVLHHLGDPQRGWQMLKEVLLPAGTMYLGVYGKLARMPVQFARSQIRELGLRPARTDMKRFRWQLFFDEKFANLRKLLSAFDLFSTSHFRDLLFHASEYNYTLSEIHQIIDELELEFLGFRLNSPLKEEYRELFPEDPHMNSFENWHKFEQHYTGSIAMFRFWVRKGIERSELSMSS